MLTLQDLNALEAITWHSDEAGGLTRTLSDFQHWTCGIEFTITWDFEILEGGDSNFAHQEQNVRIYRADSGQWYLHILDEPHGKVVRSGLDTIPISRAVIDRIHTYPDAFAQGTPTRRFAVAFYGGDL